MIVNGEEVADITADTVVPLRAMPRSAVAVRVRKREDAEIVVVRALAVFVNDRLLRELERVPLICGGLPVFPVQADKLDLRDQIPGFTR